MQRSKTLRERGFGHKKAIRIFFAVIALALFTMFATVGVSFWSFYAAGEQKTLDEALRIKAAQQ